MAINVLLTGGIGSGKSSCAKVFELLGVPVFYDDAVGREVTHSDLKVVEQIKKLFGDDAYREGILQRERISSLVFSNRLLLKELSDIIHPAVKKAYSQWMLDNTGHAYTIRESALAINENNLFHSVISVSAPLELRLKRVVLRDRVTTNQVLERINNQISQEERNKSANFIVLCNDDDLVIPQILAIHNTLLKI